MAVLETLLSFVVAVTLGTGLLLAGRDDDGSGVAALVAVAGIMAVAGLAVGDQPACSVAWPPDEASTTSPPSAGAPTWSCWPTSSSSGSPRPAAFLCYLAAFPAIDTSGVVRTAGTFLLAWAAGFLAVFAPQGAGVFEATMASTLSTARPSAPWPSWSAGYRAVTALRDALALARPCPPPEPLRSRQR